MLTLPACRFVNVLDETPELMELATRANPMARLGRPDELRGIVTWLASDASSLCTGSE